MSGKSDPRALLRSWQLREDFEVVMYEEAKTGTRQRSKKYGRAQDIHMTETGRVGNKTDQVLLLRRRRKTRTPYLLPCKWPS